ncbi:MAG: polyribonucleotide nucleotidyltransferase [Oscillospiraceae bacterium]|nr:polyribonucleotide nucleotidyltransferase [Oscillospiraceae bacterium]
MITKLDYPQQRTFETTVAGRKLVVETGKMAGLANGAAFVRYGDTTVMCTATASDKPRDGIDYLPLSVDFEEKLYAVGRIPGGYIRREGRPSEKAVLTSRVIDRPIRPLFPDDLRNDVALSMLVTSVDNDCLPEFVGMVGASIALSISDIPWAGPIAGVLVGLVDGEIVINPTSEQRKKSEMTLTVAGTRDKIVMIEAGANQIDDETVYAGIMKAHEEIGKICDFILSIVAEIGKPKFEYTSNALCPEMFGTILGAFKADIEAALDTDDKNVRDERMKPIRDAILEKFEEQYPDLPKLLGEVIYQAQKKIVRRWLLDKKRVDGRSMTQIRGLSAEVDTIPRVHGSGLFARGQTQVLTVATLGMMSEAQNLDTIDEDETKRYMHHYNFPSFSVGEARPSRGPGRREIGHGALAEKSLLPVLPSIEEFPYAIRLVSEILSSNGSTSQGAVCGSTLALMAAGVPIAAPVAGISCGLITDEDGKWDIMMDIQGVEDFFGDMDFKVAGTKNGITSIQVDIKVDGLTPEIVKAALDMTKGGREQIIDEVICKAIPEPRAEVSQWAPKMLIMKVKVEKIREIIGKGGEVIQKIVADTGAKIDIDDDGTVYIASPSGEAAEAAKKIIDGICFEPEVGMVFTGKVVAVFPIGCKVEFSPGKTGFLHIRNYDVARTETLEGIVDIGDEITVKYIGSDDKGINLSRKATLPGGENSDSDRPRPPRNNDRPRGGGGDRVSRPSGTGYRENRDANNRGGDSRPPRSENAPAPRPAAPSAPVAPPTPPAPPAPAPAPPAEEPKKKRGLFGKKD